MKGLRTSHRCSAFLLLLALGACGEPTLAFVPHRIVFRHDAEEVLDAVPIDPDHDGDWDIVATTPQGLAYLSFHDGAWTDETEGTALSKARVATAGRLDGLDLLVRRPNASFERLEYSGIGTWAKGGVQPTSLPDPPRAVEVDLDRDGRPDRGELIGHRVRVMLHTVDDVLLDQSHQVGVDSLPLVGEGVAVYVLDLDHDGDLDILAVGGRLMAYLGNGGRSPLPN